jgi:hypothetical protein
MPDRPRRSDACSASGECRQDPDRTTLFPYLRCAGTWVPVAVLIGDAVRWFRQSGEPRDNARDGEAQGEVQRQTEDNGECRFREPAAAAGFLGAAEARFAVFEGLRRGRHPISIGAPPGNMSGCS